MSVEGGSIVVDVTEVSVRLKEPPAEDVLLRLDLSIVGADEELSWASNGCTRMFSTSDGAAFKKEVELPVENTPAVPEGGEKGEAPEGEEAPATAEGEEEEAQAPVVPADYIVGFDNNLRSTFIDLNHNSVGKVCNTKVVGKVYSVKPPEGDATEGTEECLLSLTVELADLLLCRGTTISTDSAAVLPENENVDAESSRVCLRLACDNDLAEYVSGGNVLRWDTLSLSSLPGEWGVHFTVEPDPKAKAEPTPEEVRAQWREGIEAKLETVPEMASYTLTMPTYAGGVFPELVLQEGKLVFNGDEADKVPHDVDIASAPGLWTVQWGMPPTLFMHRAQVRQLKKILGDGDAAPKLEFVATKTVTEAGAETEGTDVSGTASVDVTALLNPGNTRVEMGCEFETTAPPASEGEGEGEGESAPEEAPAEPEPAGAGEDGDAPEETAAEPPVPPPPPSLVGAMAVRSALVAPPSTAAAPSSGSTMMPDTSSKKVTASGSSRDVMREFSDEVNELCNKISQEYIAMFPLAPEHDTATAAQLEERKAQFLYQISSSGVYHELKEKLKPKVQRVVRERFGSRGRALGLAGGSPSEGFERAEEAQKAADQLLTEVYVYLVKECNKVLNGLFRGTMVSKQTADQEGKATLDDEAETPAQALHRLHEEADNSESDGRAPAAEQLHLERLQLLGCTAALGSNAALSHDVYMDYAKFLLRQAALEFGDAKAATRSEILAKAREVVEVAVARHGLEWETHLVLASVLAEMGQIERAEQLFVSAIALHVDNTPGKGGLQGTDDFDGYESDKICPVNPMVYGVMAAYFSQQRLPLKARKALRLGSQSWSSCGMKPKVSAHGKPRKTAVLLMSKAALYLFDMGLYALGSTCVQLAVDCDAAASAKAAARGLAPDTVPHLRHVLYRAKAKDFLGRLQYQEALEAARLSVLSIGEESGDDEVNGWLACAAVQVASGWPTNEIADSYSSAIDAATAAADIGQVTKDCVPLEAYLSLAKLRLGMGSFEDALKVAVDCCAVYPHASAAYLVAGVCCLRLDRSTDAEDALQEANLLDNRNPEVWAFLSLLCNKLGPARAEEADASLRQALRLGLSNASLLRELATAYVALDRLAFAEDLVRRAASAEVAVSQTGKASAFTRKLLADVLAGQNQAAEAVNAYQDVIGDEVADKQTRIDAGQAAVSLLQSLGRLEEMYQLNSILVQIRSS